MKILFIGQLGIPVKHQSTKGTWGILGAEARVMVLAKMMSELGHEAVVTAAKPYAASHLSNIFGVQVRPVMSFDPRMPGGWINALLTLRRAVKERAQVVHLHSWKMGVLGPAGRLLMPSARLVWTIDKKPRAGNWVIRKILREAEKAGVEIAAPSRSLQYWLLVSFGVRSKYIPDGFEMTGAPLVRPRHFGLRGKYNLTLAKTPAEVRKVARAYKLAGLRRKLVVLADERGSMKRVAGDFPQVTCVGEQKGRVRESLIAGAEMVIIRGRDGTHDEVMTAMAYGKPVIASPLPYLEETLGVSAMYVGEKDETCLAEALKLMGRSEGRRRNWGKKTKARYEQYFSWEKVRDEYAGLYAARQVRLMAVDSVRPALPALSFRR